MKDIQLVGKWNFELNNSTVLTGLAESGIETFKGSQYESLAREICQNSLDARKDDNLPVRVEFMLTEIESSEIPDQTTLLEVFNKALTFWEKQNNNETVEFCKKNIEKLKKNYRIPILRISDFNTKGLEGSEFKNDFKYPWNNLIMSNGSSNKGGSEGGSFGIGKNAPFACSQLRTIFYSTFDQQGIKASQGISKLISYPVENNRFSPGTGYFSQSADQLEPIKELISLDENFKRGDRSGTDIFVVDFTKQLSWKEDIIASILDNYLLALYKGSLEVLVQGTLINQESLENLINEFYKEKKKAKNAYSYYQVLTSPETIQEKITIKNIGEAELTILFKNDLNRKVLMSRNNGMKIFDKDRISGSLYFSGICFLKDDKINSYFKKMEDPKHKNWEPDRYGEKKTEAKKNIKFLNSQVRKLILENGKKSFEEITDAKGMNKYLPDCLFKIDNNSSKSNSVKQKNKINVRLSEGIRITNAGINSKDGQFITYEDDLGLIEEEINGEFLYKDRTNKELKEKKKNDFKNAGFNNFGEENFNIGSKEGKFEIKRKNRVNGIRYRLIDLKESKYRLIFLSPYNISNANIQFSLVGETKSQNLDLKNAVDSYTNKKLLFKDSVISLGSVIRNKKYIIDLTVNYDDLCTMEVKIYGTKI